MSGSSDRILGIETSCDETAAACVRGGIDVLSSVVSSQVDLHARFGGVVPEIASRAHVDLLTPVVAEAMLEGGVDDGRSLAAVERGARNLTLEVRVTNEAAQGLYRAFGFAPAGIRKGYYVETNEDALIMWANDVDTPDYAARLDALAASVQGATVVEDLER